MKKISGSVLCVLLPFLVIAQNFRIENGEVWNGEGFVKRDLFVSYGTFTEEEPTSIDSVIDAANKFIIPPFGDFHTHSFDGDYAINTDSIYLAQGIFFAQDLVNDPLGRRKMTPYLDRKNTIDVAFANGCLTSNYGHPIAAYERMGLGINWPKNQAERDKIKNSRIYENRTYYLVDSKADVNDKMESFLSTQPDLLKVILWNAEEYENADRISLDNLGLNPALLPAIVAMSRTYKLPVVAHIETEKDLNYALDAGITKFAHAPFYSYANNGKVNENYPKLSEETLEKLSTATSAVLNPTLYRTFLNLTYLPKEYQLSAEDKKLLNEFHRTLLLDLKRSGVKLVAGADFPGLNAVDEIMYYAQLAVFSNKELLNILIETSEEIFPTRKIGRLEKGYEANLLLLDANPIEAIENVKNVVFRMKAGIILE